MRQISSILLILFLLSACTPPGRIPGQPGVDFSIPTVTSSLLPARPSSTPTSTSTITPTQVLSSQQEGARLENPSPLATVTPLPPVPGRSLHVSPEGNEGGDGSAGNPYQTIQQCADAAQPGDECMIHEGVYREIVRPARSGDFEAPIRFTRFEEDEVVVSGADPLSGWILLRDNIYQTSLSWTLGRGKDQVFVDGQPMVEARHPNLPEAKWTYPVEGLNPLWPSRASFSADPEAHDIYSLASKSIDGFTENELAEGVYQGWHNYAWSAQTGLIASSSPGKIAIDPETVTINWWWDPSRGAGMVSGAEAVLDTANEWYLDPQNGSLQVWLPGGADPNTHTVEVKRRTLAFDLRERTHIQLVGLKVFAASISLDQGAYNIIDRCQMEYISHHTLVADGRNGWIDPDPQSPAQGSVESLSSGMWGIYLGGHDNAVTNSVIRYSAGAGLVLQGYRHLVHNNLIQECDYAGTYLACLFITFDPRRDPNLADQRGGHRITHNTLREAGRSLVNISGMTEGLQRNDVTTYESLVFENNLFANGCLLTNDCGNLYAFGVTLGTPENPGVFTHNVVHDLWGGYGVGLVYWDNGTWYIRNTENLLWASPGSFQEEFFFNTGGELRIWKDNRFKRNYAGGETGLVDEDFPGGRFEYGYHDPASPAASLPAILALPTPSPTPQIPDILLKALEASDISGLKVEQEAQFVAGCRPGDWIAFKDVPLNGHTRVLMHILVSSGNPGQRVEVRLDGPEGELLGEAVTQPPEEQFAFNLADAVVNPVQGIRDVYFVCQGEGLVAAFDWFRFERAGP